MLKKPIYLIVVFSCFLFSCANYLPLTGGEIDKEPPKPLKISPSNFSLNFKENIIKIIFNEHVSIKDPSKNIIISPSITNYSVLEIDRGLMVEIKESLKENTTYHINFTNSITDFNEGNILSNFSYIFSTGNVIDSLKLNFEVIDAFTHEPVSNMKVMIYDADIDSLPLSSKPYNLATTNEKGFASIDYLKEGNYKIFALKENLPNFIYDKVDETIGFIIPTLSPNDSNISQIKVFKEEPKEMKINRPISVFNGLGIVKANQKIDTNLFQKNASILFYEQIKMDSILFWFKPKYKSDTIDLIYNSKDSLRYIGKNATAPKVLIDKKVNLEHDYFEPLSFQFNTPIERIDLENIIVKEDNNVVTNLFEINKRSLVWKGSVKPAKIYEVYFPKNTIQNVYGNMNDSLNIKLNTTTVNSYQTITIHPKFSFANYIIELLNERNEVLKSLYRDNLNDIKFDKIKLGSYRIRIIEDINQNQQWDTGNYKKKLFPENVYYYKETIQLQKGFDFELDFIIK